MTPAEFTPPPDDGPWERWVEPLHPVRSIKGKLAVLVATSISASALLTFLFLTQFGWRARYALTLSVLIGLGFSQVLAVGMTRPLRQMTAAARRMAVGQPPGEVTTRSRDEVGELARAFTAMAQDLETSDAQRRDLLANVAHELRTPLAALRAQVENLVDGVRPADDVALAEVLTQVEDLSDLVQDLLGLARAEAGVVPLNREQVAVPELIDRAVAAVAPLRPDRRVVLDVPAGQTAFVDPVRVQQVLVNLLDNATRHAPSGGTVQLNSRSEADGTLVLQVTDDGPGVPQEEWPLIFERFRRSAVVHPGANGSEQSELSDQADQSVTGGTGLGLAIARWAVQLHGGRIEIVPAEAGFRIRAQFPPAAG